MKYLFNSIVFFMLLLASAAQARTWFVEKDGTGDFLSIQPAVDVAASGDTIRIGPGRFDEGQDAECFYRVDNTRVLVTQEELTLIGAGPDNTFIGPEEPYSHAQKIQLGIVGVLPCGNSILNIHGIHFQGLMHSIHAEFSDRVVVENCVFTRNYMGLVTDCREVVVKNCTAESFAPEWAMFVAFYGGNSIESVLIDGCNSTAWPGSYHVDVTGSVKATVSYCSFVGGSGVIAGGVGDIQIIDSEFSGQRNFSIELWYGTIAVKRCKISDTPIGILRRMRGGVPLVEEVTFENNRRASFGYVDLDFGYIRNCNLDKGTDFVVDYIGPLATTTLSEPRELLSSGPVVSRPIFSTSRPDCVAAKATPRGSRRIHFDMTHNRWGTTNQDSIRAWVEDGKDLKDLPYVIDWNPIGDRAVSNEQKSLGSVRALYR